jgi:predicted nucleic acid-binding protein
MILVDTSIWVAHLRHGDPHLAALLAEGSVLVHPFVIGELACGNLRNRAEILSLLRALPFSAMAEHEEVMVFIERNDLMGMGLGYVDVHLLAAAFLSGVRLWTDDRSLLKACADLGLEYDVS